MIELLKQRQVQILIAIITVILILLGTYFLGKSAGQKQAGTKFDKRQAELLENAKIAVETANYYQKRADEFQAVSNEYKLKIEKLRDDRVSLDSTIFVNHGIKLEEIKTEYETNLKTIRNASTCELCLHLCKRTNELSHYPEFAQLKCSESECDSACSAGP